ncbi:hypothetical protein A1Q2_07790 [Trichosporon asahii var. asahii CBS 8904]|uniref:Uncharacterized protein n=1 Tax=Trichosporon asahii var. asahii (strain CBS 8904) TaxID=1220162 RepID=K1W8L9_TRIAC|nr:hypothetical protein A1Q2_07790 [Trichosporon asahii var. asahii CBS 8904]
MTSIVLPNMPNTSLTPEVYTAAATRGPRRPVSRLKPIEAEIAYTWLAPVLRQWRGMKHSTDTPNPEQQQSGVWCSGASVVLARFPEFLELNAIEDQAARRTCHQVAFCMMTD